MPLNFKCMQAELKGLNVRKEGSEENKEIAIDLKFEGETSGALLKDLFGADSHPDFWLNNDDHDPRFYGINSIACSGDFEQHELKFAHQHLKGIRIHKISVLPQPHKMINIVFTASMKHPSQGVITAMSEMISESGDVEVIGALDLFSDSDSSMRQAGDEIEHTFRTKVGDSHKQQDIEEAASEESDKELEEAIGKALDEAVDDTDKPPEDNEYATYRKAVDFVTTYRKASIAGVKKELGISYNKAAKIIERMQSENIISAPGVNSIREVLVLVPAPEKAEA